MKKLMAASAGLLLGVVTAANAQNWSRDRDDPAQQKESAQTEAETLPAGSDDDDTDNSRGNRVDSRSARAQEPNPTGAMFQDVQPSENNQRSASTNPGDARGQALQFGNRNAQAGGNSSQGRSSGGYQQRSGGSQGGGTAYQDGNIATQGGSTAYRGYENRSGNRSGGATDGGSTSGNESYEGRDNGAYAGRSGSGYNGSRDGRNGGGYNSGYDGRNGTGYNGRNYGSYGSRHDGRYENRYGYDNYRNGNKRYSSGYGNRGGYDHYRTYRGKWNNHRYRSPSRYYYPRGYGASAWSVGLFLPQAFYNTQSYYLPYAPYGLEPPPYGYEWVRVDADVLLVEIGTGLIVDVLYGFFY